MSVEDALYPLLAAYERLPQGLKVGIGWTYRHLPQRVRLGSSYGEFRDLAERAEAWSASEIAECLQAFDLVD
jgi:predicted DNA-binding transcriptional regulator AlpA